MKEYDDFCVPYATIYSEHGILEELLVWHISSDDKAESYSINIPRILALSSTDAEYCVSCICNDNRAMLTYRILGDNALLSMLVLDNPSADYYVSSYIRKSDGTLDPISEFDISFMSVVDSEYYYSDPYVVVRRDGTVIRDESVIKNMRSSLDELSATAKSRVIPIFINTHCEEDKEVVLSLASANWQISTPSTTGAGALIAKLPATNPIVLPSNMPFIATAVTALCTKTLAFGAVNNAPIMLVLPKSVEQVILPRVQNAMTLINTTGSVRYSKDAVGFRGKIKWSEKTPVVSVVGNAHSVCDISNLNADFVHLADLSQDGDTTFVTNDAPITCDTLNLRLKHGRDYSNLWYKANKLRVSVMSLMGFSNTVAPFGRLAVPFDAKEVLLSAEVSNGEAIIDGCSGTVETANIALRMHESKIFTGDIPVTFANINADNMYIQLSYTAAISQMPYDCPVAPKVILPVSEEALLWHTFNLISSDSVLRSFRITFDNCNIKNLTLAHSGISIAPDALCLNNSNIENMHNIDIAQQLQNADAEDDEDDEDVN